MNVDLFLLRTALRDVIRPRRLSSAVLLALLPAAIGLLWRGFAGKDFVPGDAYSALAASLIFGFILTILSVIYGTGVVSQELEQRTIVYLLTRPVPRWRVLLAKFVGSTLAISVTVCLSAVLLAVVVYGPARGLTAPTLLRDLRILPVGALAYNSLFLLLATVLARPLAAGLLFAFGWETWAPSLPGSFGRLSLMAYLRALAPHVASERASGFLDLFDSDVRPGQAWLVLSLITLAALLAALVVFSRREYAPREEGE